MDQQINPSPGYYWYYWSHLVQVGGRWRQLLNTPSNFSQPKVVSEWMQHYSSVLVLAQRQQHFDLYRSEIMAWNPTIMGHLWGSGLALIVHLSQIGVHVRSLSVGVVLTSHKFMHIEHLRSPTCRCLYLLFSALRMENLNASGHLWDSRASKYTLPCYSALSGRNHTSPNYRSWTVEEAWQDPCT